MWERKKLDKPDLNLLFTLEAVLTEGSVAGAARRLGLSPSAMSRAVARLRATTGDPLMVRAGRGLVPTPRALELRESINRLVHEAESALLPSGLLDPGQLERTFRIRASQGFVENFGNILITGSHEEAPGVKLCFLEKTVRESGSLRDGWVDLEMGVIGESTGPEIRVTALFKDSFIGVVRKGHSISKGKMTPAKFAKARHINVSRRGLERGPVDEELERLGLERNVVAVVGGFATAIALVQGSDLIAVVPEQQTGNLRKGLHSFPLPFPTKGVTVSMLWHPRMDADPGHRWLRQFVRDRVGERLRDR